MPKVIIVGAGPGGAVVAAELAKRGFQVEIVEEGSVHEYANQNADIALSTAAYYRNGGATPILSRPIIGYVEGRAYGGGSLINGGLFWRTPQFVLDAWLENGNISQKLYDNYDSYFTELEEQHHVTHFCPAAGNRDSIAIRHGAEKLGWKVVDVPRALAGCQQKNLCPAVCPVRAKQSVDLTCLRDALNQGAAALTKTKALSIRTDKNSFVSLKLQTPAGVEFREADFLFVCGGAVQTPSLLRRSGLKRNIGDSLSLHLNLKFLLFFKEAINASHGTMFTYQVQEFMEQGILMMPTNFNPAWALSAAESKLPLPQDDMSNLNEHAAIITTQIRPKGRGKVRPFLGLGNICTMSLLEEDYNLIRQAILLSGELFFASGASHFYLPIAASPPIRTMEQLEKILASKVFPKKLELLSVHGMSSCPMGSGADAPVDFNGKLKGYENIYIADASVLPTNIGESPQGTIMYFAKHIANEFCTHNGH